METGSMMNHLMGNSAQPAPEVGMGATELAWTDRHAFTIVEVRNEKTIVVQRDKTKRTDKNGCSESQSYEYTPDPEARRVVLTRRKDGSWRERGTEKGSRFALGYRNEYHDYSF